MSSALATTELRGFLLTRHWRDLPDGTEIEYWLATDDGPKKVLLTRQSSGSAQAKDSTYGWRMRARRLRFKSGVASAALCTVRSYEQFLGLICKRPAIPPWLGIGVGCR